MNSKEYLKNIKLQFLLCFLAIIIGILTGLFDALFGIVLSKITIVRTNHILYLLPFLPIGALFIAFMYKNYGNKCSKGMSLIFHVEQGNEAQLPLLLIPFAIIATWITHLFGGSAGREGVAMQIGATISTFFIRKFKIENIHKYLLPIGMAAGFSGLFHTPIAAILFAMEILVAGQIRYPVLIPTIIASYSAYYTSKFLGLSSETIPLTLQVDLNHKIIFGLCILAILFGLVGRAFALAMHYCQKKATQLFPNPLRKALILAIVDAILLLVLYQGRYSGSGAKLIEMTFNNETIYIYDWLLKALLTILTMSAGMVGGEVVPLFTIGTTLGYVIAPLLGINPLLAAMCGYAAVFAAGTNTYFAAIFIGAEIFGYQYIPYFFIVCSIAYAFNHNESIYALQQHIF